MTDEGLGGWSRDERDLRTAAEALTGEGIAHLAGREITKIAYGIEAFDGRARRKEHMTAQEGLGRKRGEDLLEQQFGLGHASTAGRAAGQGSLGGLDNRHVLV